MIPDNEHIIQIHKKYAPNKESFDLVFTHCQAVEDIALQIVDNKKLALDPILISAAALLHDIGAYGLIDPHAVFNEREYIKHGIKGYERLVNEGVDLKLAEIARRHTGVGITKEMVIAQNLPLPPFDYLARNPLERLIMYADKFHSKVPAFNRYESYLQKSRKFGEANAQRFIEYAEEFGIPKLDALSSKYNHPLV